MAAAPVDVVIIAFPGNKFSGQIAPAILDLVGSGTIRILDLLFVTKDSDGVLSTLTIQDLDTQMQPGFVDVEVSASGILDDLDAQEIQEDLQPNSSALLVAYENTWAARFVEAIRAADAIVLDQIRIPADAVDAVMGAR